VRSIESDRILRRISSIQLGTNYTLLISAFTLSATILFVNGKVGLAVVVALIAAASAFALIRLLRRLDRLDRTF
jgi:hypothetical protein